jgi:hypothetical protein
MNTFREIVAWLYLLPGLAAVLVCAAHLGKSRWAGVLLGGFLLQTVLSVLYRVATFATGGGVPVSSRGIGAALLVASILGLVANTAIVGGIAGLFLEVRRSSGRDGHGEARDQ